MNLRGISFGSDLLRDSRWRLQVPSAIQARAGREARHLLQALWNTGRRLHACCAACPTRSKATWPWNGGPSANTRSPARTRHSRIHLGESAGRSGRAHRLPPVGLRRRPVAGSGSKRPDYN